jgi:hypothetical protein
MIRTCSMDQPPQVYSGVVIRSVCSTWGLLAAAQPHLSPAHHQIHASVRES